MLFLIISAVVLVDLFFVTKNVQDASAGTMLKIDKLERDIQTLTQVVERIEQKLNPSGEKHEP